MKTVPCNTLSEVGCNAMFGVIVLRVNLKSLPLTKLVVGVRMSVSSSHCGIRAASFF